MSPILTTESGPTPPDVAVSTVKWSAIFAGVFVTLLVYIGMMALTLIFSGSNLEQYVRGQETAQSLGVGAAIWTVVAGLVALYTGGHVAGRVAGLISTRVGRFQGMVIAAIFFTLMLTQLGIMIGALGGGMTSIISGLGGGAANVAASTVGQELIEDAVAGLEFKTPVNEVVKGVGARLLRGDQQAAINYLARQAGITPEDATGRLNNVIASVTDMTRRSAQAAGRAARTGGFVLLLTILFGTAAAMAGGGISANYNLREPVSKVDYKALRAHLAHT